MVQIKVTIRDATHLNYNFPAFLRQVLIHIIINPRPGRYLAIHVDEIVARNWWNWFAR